MFKTFFSLFSRRFKALAACFVLADIVILLSSWGLIFSAVSDLVPNTAAAIVIALICTQMLAGTVTGFTAPVALSSESSTRGGASKQELRRRSRI